MITYPCSSLVPRLFDMFFYVGTVLKIKAMNLKYYSYYDPYLYKRTRKNLIQKQIF